eukprot:2708680-Pyramimonas_sp.AAC.1
MAPPRPPTACPADHGVKLEFEEDQLEPEVREFIKSDTWAKLREHVQKAFAKPYAANGAAHADDGGDNAGMHTDDEPGLKLSEGQKRALFQHADGN